MLGNVSFQGAGGAETVPWMSWLRSHRKCIFQFGSQVEIMQEIRSGGTNQQQLWNGPKLLTVQSQGGCGLSAHCRQQQVAGMQEYPQRKSQMRSI